MEEQNLSITETQSHHDSCDILSVSGGGEKVAGVQLEESPALVILPEIEAFSRCEWPSKIDRSSASENKRPSLKDRRGCYKRRKNSESWTTVSSTVEDGQAWRKFGQKEILNATYPREYFRCTRKYDQGCQATKQVQQIKDNPKVYKTTYIGNHTCKMTRVPQMIMDAMDASDPPALDSHAPPRATVSSESGLICNKNEHHGDHGGHISSSLSMIPILPVKKEELEGTTTLSVLGDNRNDTSDMWPEYDSGFPDK